MDYQKIYNSIIENARNRKLAGYGERHHIIPRCMGGTFDKENIVKLTGREHFICHMLLTKIYPHESKLFYALIMLSTMKGTTGLQGYRVSARTYENLITEYRKIQSINQKGSRNSMYGRKRPDTSEWNKIHKKGNQYFKGKKLSEEQKEKMRQIFKEKEHSKGEKNPMYGKGYKVAGEKNGRWHKPVTQETRDKIRATKLANKLKKLENGNL